MEATFITDPDQAAILAQVMSIWKELLERDDIGLDEDFFEIGGDSLKATAVVAMAREIIQVDVPLETLFDFPTPVHFSQELCRLARVDAGQAGPSTSD